MKPSKVSIVPNQETKALVTNYKKVSVDGKQYAYIVLQSEETTVSDGWVRTKSRSAILRDERSGLEKFIETFADGGKLPGKIVVKEYLESDINAYSKFLSKDLDVEEAIKPLLKKTSKDGIELTCGGERIVRITNYTLSEAETDIVIKHDNFDEVAAWRASSKTGEGANL